MLRKITASAVCLLLSACGAGVDEGGPPRSPAAPSLDDGGRSQGAPLPPTPPAGAGKAGAEGREVASVVGHLMSTSPRREIGALEGVLAATARTSPDRPRILWRLAEDYARVEASAQRAGGKAEAQAARHKAIEYLEQLAADHPSFCAHADRGCGDAVLFSLAYEHEQEGAMDEARKAYREIIKSWPLSRYLPNAYLAFADMYFDEGMRDPPKLALAEKAYKEALRLSPPEHKAVPYAHYKLGFVHWNRGDFARAMAEMLKAIEVSEAGAKPAQASPITREARRDLIPIYAAGGEAAKAYDFFAAHSGDKSGETERLHASLEALVRVYVDTGKLEEAAEVYVDWLSRGAGPKTCAIVAGVDAVIARAAGAAGAHAKVLRTTQASAPLMKARVECASAGP